ncbi:MAG TPA: helix-turn-helix domain-containing protein [Gemmataceae bacterium]|nr:helix-turn-helix domain-containing protein [Gemmataceae bacterium]
MVRATRQAPSLNGRANGRPASASNAARDLADARPAGAPWSMADAAAFLGISLRFLAKLADEGKIRSFHLGRRRLIADAELRRAASEGTGPG